jgi:hypothetical protein
MMVNQIRAKNGIPYDSLSYENALDVSVIDGLTRSLIEREPIHAPIRDRV